MAQYEIYPKKYVTTQGDTWDAISMAFYDTPYRVHELISCNTQYRDVLVFDGNIALDIPVLSTKKSTSLAPWKRGA